jgi:hypothetical protein
MSNILMKLPIKSLASYLPSFSIIIWFSLDSAFLNPRTMIHRECCTIIFHRRRRELRGRKFERTFGRARRKSDENIAHHIKRLNCSGNVQMWHLRIEWAEELAVGLSWHLRKFVKLTNHAWGFGWDLESKVLWALRKWAFPPLISPTLS